MRKVQGESQGPVGRVEPDSPAGLFLLLWGCALQRGRGGRYPVHTVISTGSEDDFISLPDIAKYKIPEFPADVVKN